MIVVTCMLLAVCDSAGAGVQSDLGTFFNSMGLASNVTPAGGYQGQSAGYYTGGSLFARAPVRNYNLLSIQMPKARAGCGGIDLFAGGFSFVNSDQLVAMMKNIGSNAVGFAFRVGLSTISPKLDSLLGNMQDLANKVNSASINSCETAANLLGSVLPKTIATQKALCQDIGSGTGAFSDYAASRQGCGAGGQRSAVLASARTDPRFKDLVPQGNIVWRALKKISSTKDDDELAEMVMSLTGTLIIPPATDDDTPLNPKVLPPAIDPDNDNDLSAFLNGGEFHIYRCSDTSEFGCLNPTKQTITIAADQGYTVRVKALLTDMVGRMLDETDLSGEQMALLNETSLPVYKMLNVATAYSPVYAEKWTTDYADIIALDLVYQYFRSLITVTADARRTQQLPQSLSDSVASQIQSVRARIEGMHKQKLAKLTKTIQMMQESMTIERSLISSLSPGLSGSWQWAKTLR